MESIDRLDEPRRSEIAQRHDLTRDVAPLRALLAEAVRLGPPA